MPSDNYAFDCMYKSFCVQLNTIIRHGITNSFIFVIFPCCYFHVMSLSTFSDQIRPQTLKIYLNCAAETVFWKELSTTWSNFAVLMLYRYLLYKLLQIFQSKQLSAFIYMVVSFSHLICKTTTVCSPGTPSNKRCMADATLSACSLKSTVVGSLSSFLYGRFVMFIVQLMFTTIYKNNWIFKCFFIYQIYIQWNLSNPKCTGRRILRRNRQGVRSHSSYTYIYGQIKMKINVEKTVKSIRQMSD